MGLDCIPLDLGFRKLEGLKGSQAGVVSLGLRGSMFV